MLFLPVIGTFQKQEVAKGGERLFYRCIPVGTGGTHLTVPIATQKSATELFCLVSVY